MTGKVDVKVSLDPTVYRSLLRSANANGMEGTGQLLEQLARNVVNNFGGHLMKPKNVYPRLGPTKLIQRFRDLYDEGESLNEIAMQLRVSLYTVQVWEATLSPRTTSTAQKKESK